MPERRNVTRRSFLTIVGQSAIVLGAAAACRNGSESAVPTTDPSTTVNPATSVPETTAPPPTTSEASPPADTSQPNAILQPGPVEWQRIDFGSVSAYLVRRDGLTALVDTGPGDGIETIEGVMQRAGVGWETVGDVILTHGHADHAGGLEDVLARAPHAVVSAGGTADDRTRMGPDIQPLADGQFVFGFQVVATPGHTPNHISLLEPVTGLLFAGDAVRGADAVGGRPGELVGPNPETTADMAAAAQSIAKLTGFRLEAIVFGHGSPVVDGGAEKLIALAAPG